MSRTFYLPAAIGLALLAGCEMVVSVHPLSDAETSILDQRLVGQWEMVPPPEHTPGPMDVPARYAFGRIAGKPNMLECVVLGLDGDGHVQVQRIPLYATKLGDLHYLSIPANDGEPKEKQAYSIQLYELEGEDELKLHMLSKDVIGPAIERGDLAGEVKKSDPDPNAPPPELVKPKYREVKITAEPKELAAYLQRRGKAAFYTQEYFTFRRIEPK